jgi:hypothetical protein
LAFLMFHRDMVFTIGDYFFTNSEILYTKFTDSVIVYTYSVFFLIILVH